jgi:glycerol-3-phosphate dehydrogenase
VAYADGQFDDARYGITLLNTFSRVGGAALNYARVTALEKNQAGKLNAATAVIQPSGRELKITARAFVNATGPVSDKLRQMASPSVPGRMRPSRGVHILFPLDGFPDSDALLVPKMEDGRVIFAVPWNGRLMVGTTDTGYTPGEEMVGSKILW